MPQAAVHEPMEDDRGALVLKGFCMDAHGLSLAYWRCEVLWNFKQTFRRDPPILMELDEFFELHPQHRSQKKPHPEAPRESPGVGIVESKLGRGFSLATVATWSLAVSG